MHYEQDTHEAVCNYLRLKYPRVLFNTDLSGIRLTMGQAVKAKKLRSSRAFPDLVIYEPRHGYHGLFLELKRDGEKIFKKDGSLVSNPHLEEQMSMLILLGERGYRADFAVGFDQAKRIIDWYLSL